MLVEDVMTTDVATVDVGGTLREAVEVMLDRGVGSVVVRKGSPPRKTGILTDSDVKRAVYETDEPLSSLLIRENMSNPLVTVEPDVSLSAAVEKMRSNAVKHLVVTEKMRLVGMLTPTDVASAHDDVIAEIRRIDSRKRDWSD